MGQNFERRLEPGQQFGRGPDVMSAGFCKVNLDPEAVTQKANGKKSRTKQKPTSELKAVQYIDVDNEK